MTGMPNYTVRTLWSLPLLFFCLLSSISSRHRLLTLAPRSQLQGSQRQEDDRHAPDDLDPAHPSRQQEQVHADIHGPNRQQVVT